MRLAAARLTLLALLSLPALAGCDGELVEATAGPGGVHGEVATGTGGGGQTSSQVVGAWWRLVSFESGGAARTSETYWDFFADGTAKRTLVTTNLTDGVAEALVWSGRWRTIADEIEITYTAPVQGTVRFRWRVERGAEFEILWLDDLWFRRLR
ncbi:MAG: hypothetical protein ACJ8AO_13700 [Gemmatimonadaceae bacterium]